MSASDVAMLMRPASGLTSMLSRTVQVNGKGIATIFEGRERTWSEFADRVARMASVLNALGVRAGDRVAVLGMTSDRFLLGHSRSPVRKFLMSGKSGMDWELGC